MNKHVRRVKYHTDKAIPAQIETVVSNSALTTISRLVGGGEDSNTTKYHLNGVSLVCQLWPNIQCWLGSFMILRGSKPVLLRSPPALQFSRGGGSDPSAPPPPPSDPRLHCDTFPRLKQTVGLPIVRLMFYDS